MKASFDGARRNLARAFNEVASTDLSAEQIRPMSELRQAVGALLCMYDKNMQPEDGNDLSDIVLKDDIVVKETI